MANRQWNNAPKTRRVDVPGKSGAPIPLAIWRLFQFGYARFEYHKLLPRTGQYLGLRVKLLATDQIQSGKESHQYSAKILLYILCRRRRKHFPDADAQVIKYFGLGHVSQSSTDHLHSPPYNPMAHCFGAKKCGAHMFGADNLLRVGDKHCNPMTYIGKKAGMGRALY